MRWSHLCIREIYGLEPWLAVEESRVREATRQRKTMRGRESRGRTVFSVVVNGKTRD